MWLADSAVPVWAIIGQLAVQGWRVEEVAADYGIPAVEVEAALAYYRRHQEIIESRLAANSSAVAADALAVAP